MSNRAQVFLAKLVSDALLPGWDHVDPRFGLPIVEQFEHEVEVSVLRKAAKQMCEHCKRGDPLVLEDKLWWHYRRKVGQGGSSSCWADPIHNLITEIEGKTNEQT